MSRSLRRLAALWLGASVALVAAEVGLRLWPARVDPDARIHAHLLVDRHGLLRFAPGTSGWHRGYDDHPIWITINSLGFRGREPSPDDAPRIAFVGDSIVFDGGVELDDTFVARSERLLRERFPRAAVYNLGVSDVGSDQYRLAVEYGPVLALRPDRIVVGLYLNDSRPPQGFAGERAADRGERWLSAGFLRRSRLAGVVRDALLLRRAADDEVLSPRFRWVPRFLAGRWRDDERELRALVAEASFDWGAGWDPAFVPTVLADVVAMRDVARARGAELAAVIFPAMPQAAARTGGDWLVEPQRRLAEALAAAGVPALDLLPVLRGEDARSFFNDQCHLNRRGNERVAPAIAAGLAAARYAGTAGAVP